MKRVLFAVGLAVTSLAALLIVPVTPASASNVSCGSGYVRVEADQFRYGEVNLWRKGSTWCAYTRRTGSYYGISGLTRVYLTEGANARYRVSDGYRRYNAGPIYLTSRCVSAFGAVGMSTYRYSEATNRYCAY